MSDGKTDYLAEAITEAFGERCADYEPDCHCCRAWRQYDAIDPATIRREALEEAAEVVRRMIPLLPPDGPATAALEIEYSALGYALVAVRSLIETPDTGGR